MRELVLHVFQESKQTNQDKKNQDIHNFHKTMKNSTPASGINFGLPSSNF